MLKKIRVQNFMCLKDVSVDLEPLTVFVGPNSSGKSAFFKALTTFTRLLRFPVRGDVRGDFNVEPGITLDDVVWRGDTALPMVFEVWFQSDPTHEPDYTMELRRSYAGWSITREKLLLDGSLVDTGAGPFIFTTEQGTKSWPGPFRASLSYLTWRYRQDTKAGPYLQPIHELRRNIGEARRYRPSASDIASFVKPRTTPPGVPTKVPEVDEAGKWFSLALQNVWKGERATFEAIQDGIRSLHPHITGIEFVSDWRGTGIVYKTDRVIYNTPASLESDGVLLSSFLLWRLYTANPNLIICLEEPENGVHIASLKQRYELLKKFTQEIGKDRNVQVLVATHSRDFLNAIGSRSDIMTQTRVTEFEQNTGTSICTLRHYREIDQLLTEFKYQMGDLWWSKRLEGRLSPSG